MTSKILITGATGGVGKNVVSQLLARTPQPALRVSARDPSKLKVPSHVEVVKADLTDPSTFPALFNNIEKVFLYVLGTEKNTPEVVNAAKNAGVRHIVLLSSNAVVSPHDNWIKQVHVKVENVIKDSGLTYTFLRPGAFNTNGLRFYGPQIKRGHKLILTYLNSYTTPIADEDTAAVAVQALTSSSLDNTTPLLSGPRTLTQRDQVEILNKVRQETMGEKVEYEEATPEKWKEAMTGKLPEEAIVSLLKLWPLTDGKPQPVSQEFEKITGKKGMEYEDWARLHKDELFAKF